MSALVDTSVVIDVLRGSRAAGELLLEKRRVGPLHSSVVVRAEILAGMRPSEEPVTRYLLDSIEWHPVDDRVVEEAGRLGRRWLPSHGGIDVADLLVAATATHLKLEILTRNIEHFPMFPGLRVPY